MSVIYLSSPEEVLREMRAKKGMILYRATLSGRWYLTYGRGEVAPGVVSNLVAKGLVRPRYSDMPNDAFTVERTIDVPASKAARDAGQKRAIVYVEEAAALKEIGS